MGGRKAALEPFLQGELDGLCGPYAVINGIRLALGPEREMPDAAWVDLFGGMLREAAGRHRRGDLCAAGLDTKHLVTALRWSVGIMERQYEVRLIYRRPFLRAGKPKLSAVVYSLQHIQRLQNTSIIVGFGGSLDHWTVIKQVSPHYISFFDSSGCRSVRLDRCRMSYEPRLGTATEHILYVSSITMITAAPHR